MVIFELLDLIARLAALVPKPRVNLLRFHGVRAEQQTSRAGDTGEAGQGPVDAPRPRVGKVDAPLAAGRVVQRIEL